MSYIERGYTTSYNPSTAADRQDINKCTQVQSFWSYLATVSDRPPRECLKTYQSTQAPVKGTSTPLFGHQQHQEQSSISDLHIKPIQIKTLSEARLHLQTAQAPAAYVTMNCLLHLQSLNVTSKMPSRTSPCHHFHIQTAIIGADVTGLPLEKVL